MTVYVRSGQPRSMPYCCGVLEIGDFRFGEGKDPGDRYGDYLTTSADNLKQAAEQHIQKFMEKGAGYLLIMNFYRNNPEKDFDDEVPSDVEESDLEPSFNCLELMDAFEAAGAKEIATFINPNSLNEVRTLVYTDNLVSLEKK